MKKLLLLSGIILILANSQAQFVYKIKADSVLITNDSCTAELNLENSTKHVEGFLYNKGNGRTEFRRAVKLNDSTIIFGGDTLVIRGTGGDRAPIFVKNGLRENNDTVKLGGLVNQTTVLEVPDSLVRLNTRSNFRFSYDPKNGWIEAIAGPNGSSSRSWLRLGSDQAFISHTPAGTGNGQMFFFASSPTAGIRVSDGVANIGMQYQENHFAKGSLNDRWIPDIGAVRKTISDSLALRGGWKLTGNSGINSSANFIGTTDNQPLSLRTNNTNRFTVTGNGNVGIGTTTPNTSAALDVSSTTQGFLPPRMTAAQASAIVSPAEGLLVYVTSTNTTFTSKGWWGFNGTGWEKLNN